MLGLTRCTATVGSFSPAPIVLMACNEYIARVYAGCLPARQPVVLRRNAAGSHFVSVSLKVWALYRIAVTERDLYHRYSN